MCMLPKTAIWDYGLRGHDDLQIAEWPQMSKLTSDLKLLTSNTLISMCMLTKTALYCDGLRGQGNLNMTSEATSHNGFGKLYYYHFYLKFPICLLNMRNEKNLSCQKWGLNRGPLGSKSNTLTIMPQGWKQFGSSNFEVVLIRSVFGLLWPHNDLRGHIWPHIWIQWPQNPLMLWFSGL